jgi:hypothetical protein
MAKNIYKIGKELVITNDEEIKKGDWVYCIIDNDIDIANDRTNYHRDEFQKIILTTDQDLIKDDVQAIEDEFLDWFVKNPSCEGVEVIKIEDELISPKNPKIRFNALQDPPSFISAESLNNMILTYKYKIIIPKDEPKQTVQEYEQQGLQKHSYELEPKQETLSNPVIIVRNDDKEKFIHLSNGMYRTEWGILNNSISTTPLKAFDKSKFTFYYE